MPFTFTEAYKEAIASLDTSIRFITVVEISHPAITTIRLCASDRDLVIDGNTYKGRKISVSLPSMQTTGVQSLEISLSNSTYEMIDLINKALSSTDPVLFKIASYKEGDTSFSSTINPLTVTSINVSNFDLKLTASYPDIVNKKIPNKIYTTKEFPGLRQ